ncbi:MAG: anti-sigma factor [Burkholderiaceae bacterium]
MSIPDNEMDRRVRVGEYVLGVLQGEEHDETHAWVQQDRQAGAMALQWEDHFLALTDRLTPASVPDALWARLSSTLFDQGTAPVRQPVASPSPSVWQRWWDNASTWRLVSAGFAAATIALAVVPNWRTADPSVPRVAVLQQPGQAAQPGWVVSVLGDGDVQIKGLAALPTPPGKSIQIWTLAPGEKKPRSMGLLGDRQTVRLDGDLVGAVQPGQLFEFTLEQEGGSPTGLPTGPVLYIGRIVAASL